MLKLIVQKSSEATYFRKVLEEQLTATEVVPSDWHMQENLVKKFKGMGVSV